MVKPGSRWGCGSLTLQLAGTLLPLVAVASIATGVAGGVATFAVAAAAGLAAAITGAHLKFTLVTRAGFTQGVALVRLPVRGVRHVSGNASMTPISITK